MPFHRYKDPSYDFLGGAFPGTIGSVVYDRINVVDEGEGDGDGSANADAVKASGPNAGTYFVAFGEDGTSSNANRGFKALAQNTDALDDLVRASIPRYNKYDFAVAPGANNVTIPALTEVWCGEDATLDPKELFHVVDYTTGEQVYGVAGEAIFVASVDDGAGTPVIGTGFVATGVRLFFTAVVNVPCSIVYTSRTSMAGLLENAERDRDVRLLLLAFANAVYGASFGKYGLNERYRRASYLYGSPTLINPDTPGDGAQIARDGQAVLAWAPPFDNNDLPPAGEYPDPFLALWRASVSLTAATYTATYMEADGNIGFLNIYPNRISWDGTAGHSEVGERQQKGRFWGGFVSAFPMNVDANSLTTGGSVITRLKMATPGSTSGSVLTVTAPYFVGDAGTSERAIVNDLDLVEVTFATSGQVRVYVIHSVDPVANTMTLYTLGGLTATLPTDTCTFTVYQVTMRAGGNKGFVHCPPRPVNSYQGISKPFDLMAPLASNAIPAARVGYFDNLTGNFQYPVYFYYDGSIYAASGQLKHAFVHRTVLISGAGTLIVNITPGSDAGSNGEGYSAFDIRAEAALSAAQQIIITNVSTLSPGGGMVEFLVHNVSGADITMSWGANFVFSISQDSNFGPNNGTAGAVVRWRGIAFSINGTVKFIMERVGDYEV